ncbi:hypothetical protein C8J57DRAFT_1460277 [Mycena rebaudengoi]|nr:hypothetical protein C8J57DRAFT_1460277 [Mycena rebaudengoi]
MSISQLRDGHLSISTIGVRLAELDPGGPANCLLDSSEPHTVANLKKEPIPPLQQAVTSLNSPHVLDLPVEITTHIFLDCLPGAPNYNEPSDVVLLLTKICKIWQSIALNTPRLWTSIIVDSRRPPDAGFVEAWLRRAGVRGITLELSRPEDEVGDSDYDERLNALEVQDLFTPVMSWSHQWMDVTINLSPAVCEIYFPTRRTLPILRKLDINSSFLCSEIDPSAENLIVCIQCSHPRAPAYQVMPQALPPGFIEYTRAV